MMGNKLPADIGVAVAALLRWSLETSGSENSVMNPTAKAGGLSLALPARRYPRR